MQGTNSSVAWLGRGGAWRRVRLQREVGQALMELKNLEKKPGPDPGQHGITEERASLFSVDECSVLLKGSFRIYFMHLQSWQLIGVSYLRAGHILFTFVCSTMPLSNVYT